MPPYLETTLGKFTFRVATDRRYTAEGVWAFWVQPQEGNRIRIGFTDYLQQHSGDIAFVSVKPVGTRLAAGDDVAEVETIKVALVLPSPVSGTIVEVNEALEPAPEMVNQDPYESGWLAAIEVADWEAEAARLLGPEDYLALMQSQAEQELKGP